MRNAMRCHTFFCETSIVDPRALSRIVPQQFYPVCDAERLVRKIGRGNGHAVKRKSIDWQH